MSEALEASQAGMIRAAERLMHLKMDQYSGDHLAPE